MNERAGIDVLCPRGRTREDRKKRAACESVLRSVIIKAVAMRSGSDLLLEIYLAGLWHGAELQRMRLTGADESIPAPRAVDRIDV